MSGIMNYKGFKAKVEYDERDDIFVGTLIGIDDIVTFHGSNVQELKKAFHESVDFHIEVCEKTGKPIQKSFSGKLIIRIPPEVHSAINASAQIAGKSINQWIGDVLKSIAKPVDV
ncbi:MAG: type II toxin-antitoxin system HicB family antitoxin [Candidatus Riflebacteria bacterium]|nr:type II toxin-antitoxin system HicB family antitoxin [Candidatus Riflebacteria bacterium]